MEEKQVWGGLGAFGQVKVEMRVGGVPMGRVWVVGTGHFILSNKREDRTACG